MKAQIKEQPEQLEDGESGSDFPQYAARWCWFTASSDKPELPRQLKFTERAAALGTGIFAKNRRNHG